jgi:hypothetical protein
MIFLGMILCEGTAQASLTYTFSFTDTTGTVPGTVTGEILGLSDNSTGPATGVLIESWPTALNSDLFTSYTSPIDTSLWPIENANTFTVSGGEITAAAFAVDDGDFDFFTLGTGCNLPSSECGNAFGNWSNAQWVGSASGDVTFSALSAVPEPSTFAYLALAVIALIVRARVKQTSKTLPANPIPAGRS